MHDSDECLRFSRKSAVISEVSPLYIKDKNLIIYAADKFIIAFDCFTNKILYKVAAHGDIVTSLWIQSGMLHSCGLDGRVVISDAENGRVISKVGMRYPVSYMKCTKDHYVSTTGERQSKKVILSGSLMANGQQLFGDEKLHNMVDLNIHFVAAANETRVFLHWYHFNDYSSYTFPVKKQAHMSGFKKLTCIACHPTEPIIATGNAMGEVMLWWNFTSMTPSFLTNASSVSTEEEDDNDDNESEESDDFKRYRTIVNSGVACDWVIQKPNEVKRSVLHWHSTSVTALAFTPEGKHLYSGGLEGVLVKWDLTDGFGIIRNRRFLSLLNSPIQEIRVPGELADDCLLVSLERNSLVVVNAALEVVYRHVGLDQTPARWRPFAAPRYVPPTALALGAPVARDNNNPDATNNAPEAIVTAPILVPGALGGMQVVDVATSRVLSVMDVNSMHYAMRDGVPAPLVLEAQLLAEYGGGEWVATYSHLSLPRLPAPRPRLAGRFYDNQAQIVWWRRSAQSPYTYEAVYGESLAYLNCEASDLQFTRHPESTSGFQTLLVLRDQRVVVWQYNPISETQPSQKPWNMTGCLALKSNITGRTRVPPARIAILNAAGDVKQKVHKSRQDALNAMQEHGPCSVVVCAAGSCLKTFAWIRFKSGAGVMEDMLPLTTCTLSEWPEWSSRGETLTKAEVCHLVGVKAWEKSKHLCAVLLCPPLESSEKCGGSGALYLLTVDTHTGHIDPQSGVFDIEPTGALTVHPTRGLVAIGLKNGTCAVYDSRLHPVATLGQLPILPHCDRIIARRMNKLKGADAVGVEPEALAFLPFAPRSSEALLPPLAVVVVTRRGRDKGRRDLAVYGLETLTNKPAPAKVEHRQIQDTATSSLLSRVECVDTEMERLEEGDTEANLLLPAHRRLKRRLESDEELLRIMREVSQYPIDSAPSPEQLLAQLFKKPAL